MVVLQQPVIKHQSYKQDFMVPVTASLPAIQALYPTFGTADPAALLARVYRTSDPAQAFQSAIDGTLESWHSNPGNSNG